MEYEEWAQGSILSVCVANSASSVGSLRFLDYSSSRGTSWGFRQLTLKDNTLAQRKNTP